MKKTLVIGASTNPNRYSYKAVISLQNHHHEIFALGVSEGFINKTPIYKEKPTNIKFHTVTLYINPEVQEDYYDYILKLKPHRVIFNPGTENDEFAKMLTIQNIEVEYNCTLVMLATNQY